MLTVAFDYDGVSYPFCRAAAGWGRETRGIELPEEPAEHHFWRGCGLSDADWDAFLIEFGEDGGFRREDPYPEALAGIIEIFDAGHDCVGATSRPATRAIQASTFGWSADWFLPFRSILLGPLAKLEIECDLIIDDTPSEIERVEDDRGTACGILLARPWNEDAAGFARVPWEALPAAVEILADAVAGEPDADRAYVIADLLDGIRDPISVASH